MDLEREGNGRIVGVLLLAGASRRFGADKRLATLADGTPIAVACARALRPAVDLLLAVLREQDEHLAARLGAEDVHPVVNPAPAQGLGGSVARGVAASRNAAGWVVLPGDLPKVSSASCAAVAGVLRSGGLLAAPFCRGRRGHPVGFAARFGPELACLRGPVGARTLLAAHAARLQAIEVEDEGIFMDVDTPAALRRLERVPR